MNELHYQLDLLKAMNQKLKTNEQMYQSIIDSADGTFVYYSYENNEIHTVGKWDQFFDFRLYDYRDLEKIIFEMEQESADSLRDLLFADAPMADDNYCDCYYTEKKIWFRFRVSFSYDESHRPVGKAISIIDVTRYKLQSEELTYFAYYDEITGLYNRNYFVSKLSDYIRNPEHQNNVISVIMIDIDDFHRINDGLGIMYGDEVIHLLGQFIKELCNDKIIACHLNSDIFCVAVFEPDRTYNSQFIYHSIRERNNEVYHLSGGQDVYLTVSMGVAEYPEASTDALGLMNCAEIAVLKCKMKSKNSILYLDAPILNDFLTNIEIENKLRNAVFKNSFELYFQPQYFADTKRLRGMEALIRWRDQENRMISPGMFIPIAEKNGAILPIGKWVVEESIRQYSEWRDKYNMDFVMSINISAKQYMQEDFVENLLNVLDKYSVNATNIELEITESVLIEDFELVTEKLHQLKERGIRISLDDFGTGFSSLSYLKQLPINTLKIDKSFIDTVLTDSATRIITESIIEMVKSLGFESVAEGVEEESQYRYLHAIGCDIIQGFLLGKPLAVPDVETLLQNLKQSA